LKKILILLLDFQVSFTLLQPSETQDSTFYDYVTREQFLSEEDIQRMEQHTSQDAGNQNQVSINRVYCKSLWTYQLKI